jgi:hypothetical protein
VRGKTEIHSSFILVHIGEIKSGDGYYDAITQLIKRLTVIALATTVLTSTLSQQYSKVLNGEIFTATTGWKIPTQDEIVDHTNRLGLKSFGEIEINIECLL